MIGVIAVFTKKFMMKNKMQKVLFFILALCVPFVLQAMDMIEAIQKERPLTEITSLMREQDINQRDYFNRTPLMWAVAKNRADVVTALLQAHADINAKDNFDNNAIIIAVSKDAPADEIIRALLGANADIFSLDKANKNALDYALENTQLSMGTLRLMKLQPKIRFLSLIETASPEQIKQALRYGAKADDAGMLGVSPLMMAAAKNPNTLVIDLLLGGGAKINDKDPMGQTALFYAVRQNPNPYVIQTLLDRGAFVQIKDKKGKRPKDYAKDRKDLTPEILKRLGQK